jgi:hypothetical protein
LEQAKTDALAISHAWHSIFCDLRYFSDFSKFQYLVLQMERSGRAKIYRLEKLRKTVQRPRF